MKLIRKYVLVGAVWGLVLGYGAVAIATGLGVAFLWALVYGDGPWADNTSSLLYGLALLALVGTVLFCMAVGYTYGKWAERQAVEERRAEHRRAHLLIAAALASAVLGGYQLHAQNAALVKRQAWLEELLVRRHELTDLRVSERPDHTAWAVAIEGRGTRAGQYVLSVTLHDALVRQVYEHREGFELPAHAIDRVVEIPYARVLERLDEFSARGGAAALGGSATLTITARLTPVLTPRELRVLPRHVAINYQAPDSPFHSERQVSRAIEYRVDGRDYWIASQGQWHRVRQ
ncbi:MAG TPA: hypothetical protein PL143_00825 [Rhodocyclaceae bacterium]|nr:hypothetical protein [Rhodocyclaceae bacterium]